MCENNGYHYPEMANITIREQGLHPFKLERRPLLVAPAAKVANAVKWLLLPASMLRLNTNYRKTFSAKKRKHTEHRQHRKTS